MKIFLTVVVVLSLIAPYLGKIYDRCTLINEMKSLGVARDELARWDCIAQEASAYNSSAISDDGCYGIFQISSEFWCQPPNGIDPPEGCHVKCEFLLNNLSASLKCAHFVLGSQGWSAWEIFGRCYNDLPAIDNC